MNGIDQSAAPRARKSVGATLAGAVAGLLALAACGALTASGPAAVDGDSMRNIDSEGNVGDWMSYGRGWDEQRFSPLDQINDANVQQLGLAWYEDLDTLRGVQATPLVIDGVLYNVSVFNVVTAYNAATGEKLWTYDPKVNPEWARLACCGPSTRGISAWKGKLFIGALDGRLIALDAKTGKEVWTTKTFENDQPYSITGPTRVFDGKVVIGNGGADYGVRGFVSAYDAETGKKLWKFYIVPGNPADGADGEASDSAMKIALPTWTGEWWKYGGGGPAWASPVYDPKLNLAHIGPGHGSPPIPALPSRRGVGLYLYPADDAGRPEDRRQGAPGHHAGAQERLLLRDRPEDRPVHLGQELCSQHLGQRDRPEDRAADRNSDRAPDL